MSVISTGIVMFQCIKKGRAWPREGHGPLEYQDMSQWGLSDHL